VTIAPKNNAASPPATNRTALKTFACAGAAFVALTLGTTAIVKGCDSEPRQIVCSEGADGGCLREPEHGDRAVKRKMAVPATQEDKGCDIGKAEKPTKEQFEMLAPIRNAAIEAVMGFREAILEGKGEDVRVGVKLYVCKDTRHVLSISGAGEKKGEVIGTLSELLMDVSPSSQIDTPVVFTVHLRLRRD